MKRWFEETFETSKIKKAYLCSKMQISEGRIPQLLDYESKHPGPHACNILVLCQETGDISIIEKMAKVMGYRLVPESALEALDNPAVREMVESLSHVVAAAKSGRK
jgi:hypothetical protein